LATGFSQTGVDQESSLLQHHLPAPYARMFSLFLALQDIDVDLPAGYRTEDDDE
jgi:hypothetical protein